jgi:hypothetical protein
MRMTLDHEYCLRSDTRVLGVAGEVNGRTMTFHGFEVSGATSYKVLFGLPDKTSFEGTITDGKYIIPATPALRSGRVLVQVVAANGTSMIRKSQPYVMIVVDSIDYEPHEGEILPAYGEQVLDLDGIAAPNVVGVAGDIFVTERSFDVPEDIVDEMER